MTLSTLRVYSFEKWYLRPTIKSAANYCKLMKFEHLVRQMDFRSEERKNQITNKDKHDTSSATGGTDLQSILGKRKCLSGNGNEIIQFVLVTVNSPPPFFLFFILTHKLMFCKQMNPNTRRTLTKFVINRIKTIFGTACFTCAWYSPAFCTAYHNTWMQWILIQWCLLALCLGDYVFRSCRLVSYSSDRRNKSVIYLKRIVC